MEHCWKKSDRRSSRRVGALCKDWGWEGDWRFNVAAQNRGPWRIKPVNTFSSHLYVLCKPEFCDIKAAVSCRSLFSSTCTFIILSKCTIAVVFCLCLLKFYGRHSIVKPKAASYRTNRKALLIFGEREVPERGQDPLKV